MEERVILALKNDVVVCIINEQILGMIEAQQNTYLPIDSVVDHDQVTNF